MCMKLQWSYSTRCRVHSMIIGLSYVERERETNIIPFSDHPPFFHHHRWEPYHSSRKGQILDSLIGLLYSYSSCVSLNRFFLLISLPCLFPPGVGHFTSSLAFYLFLTVRHLLIFSPFLVCAKSL